MNISFKKWNNRLGIIMFLIGSIVYLLTMERKLSFWDCGEYIVSSAKLGVTHAPGAALFQLIGAVWSGLAFGDGAKYALAINSMSAICSALTIMFLFWTITHFVRRMFNPTKADGISENVFGKELNSSQTLIALGSGLVGSAVFMFSDTFWFSAVEGEVYAMASVFTALLVWLGCKWEEEKDEKRENKWLLLISLVIGLGTGVHLMVILAIPVACYLYYAKHYKFTVKNFIIANILTAVFLGFVFKVLFETVMTFFGNTEVFVVNNFGLPFNSGTFVAGIILAAVFYFVLRISTQKNWKLVNTMTLSLLFMLIGFSAWMMIPIRANANPHMNLNDPDTALGMLDYFNRTQYGDWPTVYGKTYVADIAEDGIATGPTGNYETRIIGENYVKDKSRGKYIKVSDRKEYVYNKKYLKFFPKMYYSDDPDTMENYAMMYGFPEFSLNTSYFNNLDDSPEIRAQKRQFAEQIYSELIKKRDDHKLKIADLKENADILNIESPTFWQQMNYFIDFQLGYMGFRYFMWNFSGRQNDWEGNMQVTKGNWISGISPLDNYRLGDQSTLPAVFKENKAHNVYFMLPLILGLIGFFVQLNRNMVHWWAILSLFLLTSVGIIFYTSVKPFEPRERDYALVSSFYAFAIWVGLGVQGIYLLIGYLRKKQLQAKTAILISGLCLLVPILMGFQNWDDHDRSKREGAYALAYNYLNNLDKNSILFVYGDNDTYPLWGLQETEKFRDDLKIVNYTLLGSPWNIEQSLRKTYNAAPLPSKLEYKDYQLNTNDNIMVVGENIKSIFSQLHSLFKEERDLSVPEIMELPPNQVTAYLNDPGYDPAGIQELYRTIRPLEKYIVQDSMTAKEAYQFLMEKSAAKDALADYFEYPVGAVNYLPVDKIVIPVNKENALKYGIVSAKDADKIVDHITIKINKKQLYKPELLMISMFAEYNWDRAIYFSGGGISDSSNVFWLTDYLENNGFSYKLIPIKTTFGKGGKLGRSNPEKMLENFKDFKWANYNLKNASFSNTDRNYTNTYRNISSRLALDFIEKGDKKTAIEILDKVMEMIPDEPRYDYGLATERIALAYRKAGQEEKASKLLETVKQRLVQKIDYYESLPDRVRYTVSGDLSEARSDYSMMIYEQVRAYLDAGQKDTALKLFQNEFKPIREKLIQSYQGYKTDGIVDVREQRNIDGQFRFVSELLGVADMIDTVYANKQSDEIYEILTNKK